MDEYFPVPQNHSGSLWKNYKIRPDPFPLVAGIHRDH